MTHPSHVQARPCAVIFAARHVRASLALRHRLTRHEGDEVQHVGTGIAVMLALSK